MKSDTLTVKVTEEHIALGRKGECFYCPIALAVKQAVKGSVLVMRETVYVEDGWTLATACLGQSDQAFIRGFDAGNKMSPFTLYLHFDNPIELRP